MLRRWTAAEGVQVMRNKLMAAVALAAVLAGGKPADAALMTYTATRLLNAILIPKPRVFWADGLTSLCGRAVVCKEMDDSLGCEPPREIAHGPGDIPDLAVLCR